MSTRIPAPVREQALSARTKYKIDKSTEIPPAVATQVDITSLEIASDYEADCDPYNRTGQFCVEAMKNAK